MAIETWNFVQQKSKQATKQVLGIKDEAARCAAARCAAARFEGDAAAGGGTMTASISSPKGAIHPAITVSGSMQHPSAIH